MKKRRIFEWMIVFAWFALSFPRQACAIQTEEIDIGRGGVYDGIVKIVRDPAGRLTLCDSELTSPVTLGDLRYSGTAHWLLQGLTGDDHPQYHNDTRALAWLGARSTSDLPEGSRLYYTDTRARQSVSAAKPLTYNPSTGVFGVDSATTATFAGLALTGLTSGAIPYVGQAGNIAANANRLSISSAGNFGVGTSAPENKLDVLTEITGFTTLGRFRGNIDPGYGATRLTVSNPVSNFTMSAYGSAAPGILANCPAIVGTAATGGAFLIAGAVNTPIRFFANDQYLAGNHLVIATTGNVGISTSSPGSRLSISGNAALGSNYCASAAPTNGMIVEGNVGIGTTTPTTKLDVNGAARMRGPLVVDGATTVGGVDVSGRLRYVGSAAQPVTADAQTISPTTGLITLDPDVSHTLISTPSIGPGVEGQILTIVNQDADCFVRFNNQSMQPGTNLALGSATRTLYRRDVLTLIYTGGMWCEISFASNHN